jgi:hypothetical protein
MSPAQAMMPTIAPRMLSSKMSPVQRQLARPPSLPARVTNSPPGEVDV